MRAVRANRGLSLVALLALAACGPVTYVSQVSREATAAVTRARAAGADKRAPYWFTLATEYLDKAREEAAQADFQSAVRLGRRATEAAERALAESEAR
jgi:hypothetical protein